MFVVKQRKAEKEGKAEKQRIKEAEKQGSAEKRRIREAKSRKGKKHKTPKGRRAGKQRRQRKEEKPRSREAGKSSSAVEKPGQAEKQEKNLIAKKKGSPQT